MQCSNCRANISDSTSKFCSFCGNPLSKIQKEEEEFFRGVMKSNTKPQEIWNFDKGNVKCAEGNSKVAFHIS